MHLAFLSNGQMSISHFIMYLLENQYQHFKLPVLYSYINNFPEQGSHPLANL